MNYLLHFHICVNSYDFKAITFLALSRHPLRLA